MRINAILWLAEQPARPIMKFNDQDRQYCHPERSEGSDSLGTEILRCAQDDRLARFQTPYRS